jgi:polyhydroxyalkanoate synthesis regulator phasin
MDDIRAELLKMWRSSWENSVKNLTMVQEQGNKMFDLLLTQGETIQTETKKLIKEGMANAQEAQKSYFQAMEENLKKIEELLAQK